MSSRRADETRGAILDAARSLFEAQGYHAVGLEAVARAAGVSRQAIYLHFDSKATLLTALHERVNEQDVAPVMGRVWECPGAVRGLDAFVAATATAVPRFLGIFRALEPATYVEEMAEETFQRPREGRYADCLRMAEWLEAEGALQPGMRTRQAADILFALASVWSYEALVVRCGWSARRWTTWTREALHTALLDSG
jgi:AcrR family transcriptional regulator